MVSLLFIHLAGICWIKGGKNCFFLVHIEGLCTHISQQQYSTPSHKRQRRERGTPSLLQKEQRLLRSRDRDGRQASESSCCSPHGGERFLSALTKSQHQQALGHSHSAVLSASSWPLVPNGLSHTFLPSFSFSLLFSLPAFLSERTPLTRVSGFSCLCPGKLKDPFSFLFLTRIIHSG